jgi:hypothetical protein
MSSLGWRIVAAAALLGFALIARAAADDTGLEAKPDRAFVHKESKTALQVPEGWTIIAPYRLRRTSTSTVLGLEKQNPLVSVTIVWSQLAKQEQFSKVVRAASEGDLGNEYDTLVAIYGKNKVSRPITFKVGPYLVYKILIDDGPEKGLYGGACYLFEAGSGDNRWKVKIRADFPQANREKFIKEVEEVVGRFKKEE